MRPLLLLAYFILCAAPGCSLAPLPTIGEWDGVTPSARLEGPYEDPRQANVPFGIISYFNQPWRSYMDTWPAQQYLNSMAVGWYLDAKFAAPVSQLLAETGIRAVRLELGWGSLDWTDSLPPKAKTAFGEKLRAFQAHGIRPLILLPVTGASDTLILQAVTTTGGQQASLVSCTLDATAHPGLSGRAQRYLLLRHGADLLLVSLWGTPEALQAREPLVQALFAGVSWPEP
jgi:hypothetical protein